MLKEAVQEKLEHDPDAITRYAPVLPVTHRPYQSKPSIQELAFQEELERIKAGKEQTLSSEPAPTSAVPDDALAEYPGLVAATQRLKRKLRQD